MPTLNIAFIPCTNGNNEVEIISNENLKNTNIITAISEYILKIKTKLKNNNENDCGCDYYTPAQGRYFPFLICLSLAIYITLLYRTEVFLDSIYTQYNIDLNSFIGNLLSDLMMIILLALLTISDSWENLNCPDDWLPETNI